MRAVITDGKPAHRKTDAFDRAGQNPTTTSNKIFHSGRKMSVRPDSPRGLVARILRLCGGLGRPGLRRNPLLGHTGSLGGGRFRRRCGLLARCRCGLRCCSRGLGSGGRLLSGGSCLGLGLANRGHELIASLIFGRHNRFTISSTSCRISSAAATPWLPTSSTLLPWMMDFR